MDKQINTYVFCFRGDGALVNEALLMRWNKVPCNSQLYSEHQTIYSLRVKRSHMSKVSIHKGKPHGEKTCFSIEVYKQIATASCNELSVVNLLLSATSGRGKKTQTEKSSIVLKKLRSKDSCLDFLEFSHKHSEISSHNYIFGPCSDIITY